MQNRLEAKVIAAETPEELEKQFNEFLAQNIKVHSIEFAMDGTYMSYNLVILYESL